MGLWDIIKSFFGLFIKSENLSRGERSLLNDSGGKDVTDKDDKGKRASKIEEKEAKKALKRAKKLKGGRIKRIVSFSAKITRGLSHLIRGQVNLDQQATVVAAVGKGIAHTIQKNDNDEQIVEVRDIRIMRVIQRFDSEVNNQTSRSDLISIAGSILVSLQRTISRYIEMIVTDEKYTENHFVKFLKSVGEMITTFGLAIQKISRITDNMQKSLDDIKGAGAKQFKYIRIEIWKRRTKIKKLQSLFAVEIAKGIFSRRKFNVKRMAQLRSMKRDAQKELERLKDEFKKIGEIYGQLKSIRAYARHTIKGLISDVEEIKDHHKHIINIKSNMDSLVKKRVKPTQNNIVKTWKKYVEYIKKSLSKPPKEIDKVLIPLSGQISQIFVSLVDMLQINIMFHNSELKPLVQRLYKSLETAWHIEKREKLLSKIGVKLVRGFEIVEQMATSVLTSGESVKNDTTQAKRILTELGKIQEEEMTTERRLGDNSKESSFFAKSANEMKDTVNEIDSHIKDLRDEINTSNQTRENVTRSLEIFSSKLNDARQLVHSKIMNQARSGQQNLRMTS